MSGIDISEKAGVRFLHFSSDWVQGAMRIARPYALELDYTREMMLPLLLRDENWPRRVLLIGLGAASQLKFLWRHRPEAKLTVVEINPKIPAAARQFFKLPDDPDRVRIHIADGADFIMESKKRYDLILVDGFDAEARANRLDSLPFYLNCATRLKEDGILCVNLLSRRLDFSTSIGHLRTAFDENVLAFPSSDTGNTVAIATNGASTGSPTTTTLEQLFQADKEFMKATRLSLLPLISRLSTSRHFSGGVLQF